MDTQLATFFKHFVTFSDEELQEAAHFFRFRHFDKNEHFVKAGDMVSEILFVKKGVFRIYTLVDGKEVTRFLSIENIFVTSDVAFSNQIPSVEYVQALEDSETFAISHTDLDKMCSANPKWDKLIRIIIEKWFSKNQHRVYTLIADTAQTRYERFINENPELYKRVPQYIIANYLGISPETLSRLRKIS